VSDTLLAEERKKKNNNNKKRSKHNMSPGDIIMVNLEKLKILKGTIM
jgi:hypothetical protein